MSRMPELTILEGRCDSRPGGVPDAAAMMRALGVDSRSPDRLLATLPFGAGDVTAGSETELQAVVQGRGQDVDLPRSLESSNYFTNLIRRSQSGESSPRLLSEIRQFLTDNDEGVWENSWVRFPRRLLSPYADQVLRRDLLADKGRSDKGLRRDVHRFLLQDAVEGEMVRVPISYLVKIALADHLGCRSRMDEGVRTFGGRLLEHYLSDNTSPETFSFHVVPLAPERGLGKELARETSKRFLLTHLLCAYANRKFALEERGQKSLIYFAPHPPQRQKKLNDLIPDAFYRELFMSPCLSGWDEGERKHQYMQLCHQVLGRSQLNAIVKLREAGIIANNLVVLPNISNTSLANNGTHISLGSRHLTRRLAAAEPGFGRTEEKVVGDLAIKIMEHFLPLFVGTYSGAPYRLDFEDFHPEKALGFLPHELDYTHLRMLWRRWRKKADISVMGRSLTPFGPPWIDRGLSRIMGLKGDFIGDFRLIDYPVGFLSTPQSPAFDGCPGNQDRLKADLAEQGVFDRQMSLYLFMKQREHAVMGFSGFEGRYYSQFESLQRDMGHAASLQTLLCALACKLIATGKFGHGDIPDTPTVESERRQIFFGTAIGIPTFFVRKDTPNRFLLSILQHARNVRSSSRYPGYLRIHNREYQRALIEVLRREASDLVQSMGLGAVLDELQLRMEFPQECGTAGRLTRGVLETLNARSPMEVEAGEFNRAAETFYRGDLRRRHLEESLDLLEEDLQALDPIRCSESGDLRERLNELLPSRSAVSFLKEIKQDVLRDRLALEPLKTLIDLTLLALYRDSERAGERLAERGETDERLPSVHRAG